MTRRNEEKLRIQCQRKLENKKDNAQAREFYLKDMGQMGTLQENVVSKSYVHMIPEKQRAINQNDLRHQARVLRNSCLYMGPVNEYFWA